MDRPAFLTAATFHSAMLADAVNHYVRRGERAALAEFKRIDAQARSAGLPNERGCWLCRILFEGRPGATLRPPWLGGTPWLPVKSMPAADWPIFPLALSRWTYFALTPGYEIGGVPESLSRYLTYCRTDGVFRREPIAVPTRAQALEDAEALRQSDLWKSLRWSESVWRADGSRTWEFLRGQAERVPK